jgi:hypothetical protein
MLTCEACGHEMESKECSCGGENLADALYCSYCGDRFQEQTLATDTGPSDDPFDLHSRILCSDDACIGIINERGVCTECGKPANPSA